MVEVTAPCGTLFFLELLSSREAIELRWCRGFCRSLSVLIPLPFSGGLRPQIRLSIPPSDLVFYLAVEFGCRFRGRIWFDSVIGFGLIPRSVSSFGIVGRFLLTDSASGSLYFDSAAGFRFPWE